MVLFTNQIVCLDDESARLLETFQIAALGIYLVLVTSPCAEPSHGGGEAACGIDEADSNLQSNQMSDTKSSTHSAVYRMVCMAVLPQAKC